MPDKSEKKLAYDRAVRDLGVRNRIDLGEIQTQLACLIRPEDMRPFAAPWWTGKEAYLMAVDFDGNFILRHSGGRVLYCDRTTKEVTEIAGSVAEFIAYLDWA